MIKKMAFLIIGIMVIVGGYFWMKGSSVKSEFNEAFLVSNEEGIFNTSDAGSMDVPTCNFSEVIKDEVIQKLGNVSGLIDYSPYYPLMTGSECQLKIIIDGEEHSYTLPYKGKKERLNAFVVLSYYDKEYLFTKNNLSKKYDNDKGIYVSERIFNNLNLNISGAKEIIIQCELLFPKVIKEPREGEYRHTVQEYTKVEAEFLVSGTFSSSSVQECIFIPWEISEELYEQIDFSNTELSENEYIWQPNTYLIQYQGEIEEIVENLSQSISDFGVYYFDDTLHIPLEYIIK